MSGRPSIYGAPCPQCGTPPGQPCPIPGGYHHERWQAASGAKGYLAGILGTQADAGGGHSTVTILGATHLGIRLRDNYPPTIEGHVRTPYLGALAAILGLPAHEWEDAA